MERGTTLFLKGTVILIGIPFLAMCIFVVPEIGKYLAESYPEHAYLKYLVFMDLYATAIPFYFALYQAFKLLSYIDMNKAFTDLSVRALKNIRNCALSFAGLYVIGLPLFFLFAQMDDAPGLILIVLVIIFAALVVAMFAAVLQKLLKQAIDIQAENDLTV
jgi:hypothetical protein